MHLNNKNTFGASYKMQSGEPIYIVRQFPHKNDQSKVLQRKQYMFRCMSSWTACVYPVYIMNIEFVVANQN